jgi:hypothetical protein
MLLFVILEGISTVYGAAYAWHCIKRKRNLGTAGALLLCLFSLIAGVLLYIYVM